MRSEGVDNFLLSARESRPLAALMGGDRSAPDPGMVRRVVNCPLKERSRCAARGGCQQGEDPDDWKPMNSIGSGVREVRVRDANGAFRVICVAKLGNAIYVLHCFQKKSQRTRKTLLWRPAAAGNWSRN